MAKQRMFDDMTPDVPEDVQVKADAYASALRSLGKAKGKKHTAEEVLIAAMKDADIKEVSIDMGNKRIILTAKDTLKVKKQKGKKGDGDEE